MNMPELQVLCFLVNRQGMDPFTPETLQGKITVEEKRLSYSFPYLGLSEGVEVWG